MGDHRCKHPAVDGPQQAPVDEPGHSPRSEGGDLHKSGLRWSVASHRGTRTGHHAVPEPGVAEEPRGGPEHEAIRVETFDGPPVRDRTNLEPLGLSQAKILTKQASEEKAKTPWPSPCATGTGAPIQINGPDGGEDGGILLAEWTHRTHRQSLDLYRQRRQVEKGTKDLIIRNQAKACVFSGTCQRIQRRVLRSTTLGHPPAPG